MNRELFLKEVRQAIKRFKENYDIDVETVYVSKTELFAREVLENEMFFVLLSDGMESGRIGLYNDNGLLNIVNINEMVEEENDIKNIRNKIKSVLKNKEE